MAEDQLDEFDEFDGDPEDAPDGGEFEVGEDFAVTEVVYPYAPPQQWVLLSDEFTRDELAVYGFVMCHLNPWTGKFTAWFGRQRLVERFSMSEDWVDKQLRGLTKKGAFTKTAMYWIDPKDHRKGRTTKRINEATGKKRAQAPNRYRVNLTPPGGAAYPKAIRIAEFYRPHLITKRVRAAGSEPAGQEVPAVQRPPLDQGFSGDDAAAGNELSTGADNQGEQATPQVEGSPPASGDPLPASQRGPGAAAQRVKRSRGLKDHGEEKDHENNHSKNYKTGGQAPLTPRTDDMPGKPGVPSTGEPEPDLTAGPTTKPVLEGDPQTARARNEAQGPATVARSRRAGGLGGSASTTVRRFERHVEAMPDLAMPSTVKIAAQPEWRKAANRLFLARHAAGRLAADAVRVNPALPLPEVEKLVATGGIEGQDPGEVVERAAKLVACQQELNQRRGGPLPDEVHRAAVQASARWAAQSTPVPAGVDEDTWRAAVTELEVARADAGQEAAKTVARNPQVDRPFVQSLITNRMGRLAGGELIARTDRLVAAQLRVDVLAGVEAPGSAPGGMAVTA